MALSQPLKLSGKPPTPSVINIRDFKGGYNSFLDSVRIPNNALVDATNAVLSQDGVPKRRPGTRNYGEQLEGEIDGDSKFTTIKDGSLVEVLIAIADGAIYTALDGRTWKKAKGATLTVGHKAVMHAIDDKVFIANGKDNLSYYDIPEDTVKTFTDISPPTPPVITKSSDLKDGNITLFYKISAVNNVGETVASTAGTTTVDRQRDTWKNITAEGSGNKEQYVTLEITKVPEAVRYNIYHSDQSGQECYIDSVGDSGKETTTYIDEGRSLPNMALVAPLDDTTGGPVVGDVSYSDNRLFATRDPKHPYRVYWGGVGANITAFSPFFGGGWVDIQKGGSELPVRVTSYRDGKGDPVNTIFTTDASSTGSQQQVTLSMMTVGSTTFTVPMIARVIGSLGTPAPSSIIEAKNNLFYMNVQSVNTTGAKPDMLNVLSTDEVSLSIRPNVRAINNRYANQITATQFNNKLYFAVPYGSVTNNEVWALDLELKAWMRAWTLPIERFIKYTGSDGVERLLYRPSSGSRSHLVEIGEDFDTDSGIEFPVKLSTGILSLGATHMEFQRIKKVYFELLKMVGLVTVTINGTMKNRDFKMTKVFNTKDRYSYAGFDNELYDYSLFDHAPTAPVAYKQAAVKKVLKVRKVLNDVQITVEFGSKSEVTVSGVAVMGVGKKVGDPSAWKV